MFLLCLLGLLAGCSKKENTNEEQRHLAELGSKAGANRRRRLIRPRLPA